MTGYFQRYLRIHDFHLKCFQVCLGSFFPFIPRISCLCLFQENYMIFWTSDNFTFIMNLLFYFFNLSQIYWHVRKPLWRAKPQHYGTAMFGFDSEQNHALCFVSFTKKDKRITILKLMAQWISHLLITVMLMARTLPSIVMPENVVGTSRNQDLTTHCQVMPLG